jgi:hypothetical protein
MVLVVAALLWVAICGGIAFIWGTVELLRTDDREFGLIALIGLGAFALGKGLVFVLSRSLVCPLCHGTVMHEKRCQKHAGAQRLPLLSYRATAAAAVLCTGAFRCMYCGTAYRLKK